MLVIVIGVLSFIVLDLNTRQSRGAVLGTKVTDPWLKSSFSHLKVQTVCCALTSEQFTLSLCTQPSFSMHYREFSLKEISIV